LITTRGVDIWPELESSGGAVIADRTPDAFADAIERIVTDPATSPAMGEAGRRWVMDYLDVDRITSRFVEVYAKAVSGDDQR
jgi:glycosyltransferase involved in cell wall biosynthesis